ncbi:ABC transporter substrate-binding protein [Loigolactobacillus backii]|uniref:Iron ABC transporter substrate-binding protein n=1 Tax=Loigolactobacillus backii TaxID=375175 RepID=A0A192H0K2_9LACO|nr:ABC transporter substrate-binding protein [Loigolactobacillus backii]ANK60660.1 iron ABC transporter substrate-binding protein [Loigolactobacillus backii]ANK61772.1 iron ABC transporter substrate-binding protein [Loigolactobacillus backii]ANK65613.1 iron ABC transporter substrate-binding protein [Loigolactobacillus backii]ANK68088.1 iron ABC transporter substrate-binding protein [Loigolactobacillus backii]ANK69034.1 iron ABC transporter substrate-binding protein [Loigolactobacillus backii]
MLKKRFWIFALLAVTFLCSTVRPVNAAATHAFKAENGTVQVPNHPKRVVAGLYLGQVMSLGVNTVGSTKLELANPYLNQAKVKKIKDVGTPMNPESVLKLKPDLIITSNEADTKKMEKIAPTVQISYTKTQDFYKSLNYFAKLLNRDKQAAAFKQSFKKTAKQQSKRLDKAGISRKKTVGIYEMQNGKFYAYGAGFSRGAQALTHGLGFKLAPALAKVNSGAGFKEISIESVPKYKADYMFVTSSSGKGTKDPDLVAMQKNPIWKSLPAVKAKHVIELPFNKMYYYDPYATRGQLKIVTDALIKAGN